MSCDFYERKRVYLDRKHNQQGCKEEKRFFKDDRELLAYLLDQEVQVELSQGIKVGRYANK